MCVGLHVKYRLLLSDFNETSLAPKFAGSNPAEAVGKILSMPSSGGEVKESVPCLSFAGCKRT